MRYDLDTKLVTTFPNLYGDRTAPMDQTAMCWGFECGNGWFDLIWDLSKKLEAHIMEMPEELRGNCRAMQVKEKYGSLTFYLTGATPEMDDLIDKAELISLMICEECGKPGETRGYNWVYTACDEHTRGGSIP